MDEAALVPTVIYVLLTVQLVVLAARTFEWFELTGLTGTLVALLLVFEGGLAYEGVQVALR
ncbi:hypothetical protein [Halorussus marinus]|uniref:hypothetical protein n=1 Tax=Halorussus marinus TaxID=2505976 RepID=UPI0010928E66|nr:hypothetical protein [Halorussus marinus]